MYISCIICSLVAQCLFCKCGAERSHRHGLWYTNDFDSVYHVAIDRHAALPMPSTPHPPPSSTSFRVPLTTQSALWLMIFPFIDDVSRGQVHEVRITSTMLSFIIFYVDNILIFFLLLHSFGDYGSMIWAMLPYYLRMCMHSLR